MTNKEAVTYGNELIQCTTGQLREFAEIATRALRSLGAGAMREALTRYIDTQKRLSAHGSDYWMALNNVQGALNALPAPEVPDEVREWARYIDSGQLGTNTAPARALREYYRKEYGI